MKCNSPEVCGSWWLMVSSISFLIFILKPGFQESPLFLDSLLIHQRWWATTLSPLLSADESVVGMGNTLTLQPFKSAIIFCFLLGFLIHPLHWSEMCEWLGGHNGFLCAQSFQSTHDICRAYQGPYSLTSRTSLLSPLQSATPLFTPHRTITFG